VFCNNKLPSLKKYTFFLLLHLTLILWSCQSSLVITRTQPPKIVLSDSVEKLYVSGLYDTSSLEINQGKKGQKIKESYVEFIESLDSLFKERLHISLVISDSLAKYYCAVMQAKQQYASFNPQLNKDFTNSILESMARKKFELWQIPYLLLISDYNIYRTENAEVTEDYTGSKEKIVYYSIESRVIFSFYKNPGILMDQFTSQQSEEIDSRKVISILLAVGPQIKNYGNVMNRLSRQLAAEYLEQFFTQKVPVTRYYYTDKELKSLAPLMQEMRFQESIIRLLELYDKPKSVSSKHVAHNISVAYEALGQDKEAEYWKQKSK